MKKIIGLFILIAAFTIGKAQTTTEVFNMYEGKKGYTTISISQYAFELMSDVLEEDEQEFQEAVKMIEGIKIIIAEDKAKVSSFNQFIQQKFASNSIYKPLMHLNGEDGEQIDFFFRKAKNGNIKNFVLHLDEGDTSMLILIEGDNIDLKKLKQLAEGTDIKGLNNLKKIK